MNKPMSTRDIAEAADRVEAADRIQDVRPDDVSRNIATSQGRTVDTVRDAHEGSVPLFDNAEGGGFRSRWEAIQTGFVDEPRTAVEQGDALVAEVMKRLAQMFADERATLEQQWARGDNVSTEDLRIALKRYRSFFERLLAV